MRCKCNAKLPARRIRKTMRVPHETIEGYSTIIEMEEEEDLCNACLQSARSLLTDNYTSGSNEINYTEIGLDIPEPKSMDY